MTVEITQVKGCRKNLAWEIPTKDVEKEIEKVAVEYARSVKIPGFRPGKTPTSVIRRRFEKEIRDEASQRIMERVWNEAVDANNLKPLHRPEIKEFETKPGSPLKFTFTFEELPLIEVRDYKGVEIRQASAEVKDEDMDRAVDEVMGQHAQFISVEGEAKDGHFVLTDIDSLIEGKSAPSHDEDVTLIVGDPRTAAEFSEKLRGAKVDDKLSFEVSYTDDCQNKKIAGKKVAYTVLVKEIKERQVPELNDDFAKDVGFDGVDAFRARLHEDLTVQAGSIAEMKAREELMDAIIERQPPIETPECLVNKELGEYVQRIINSLAYQDVDKRTVAGFNWNKIYAEQRPYAEQSVRRMIFLDAIARQENLEVSEEDISVEMNKLASQSQKSASAWRADFEKTNRMDELKQNLLQEKALDFIYRNANIRVE